MIPMSLVGVRVEVPSNQPIVLLRENEGQRYLPIFIGQPEATAIVYALQGTETPRPMTHDLFKSVLDDLGTKVLQVSITELHDGTFFAEIEFTRDGGTYRISSRPSDAIALALRCQAPIHVADTVFRASLVNTLVYIAGSTALITVVGLGLALAISTGVPGARFSMMAMLSPPQ